MKSFLDNRHIISKNASPQGSVNSGAGFQKLTPSVHHSQQPNPGLGTPEPVANPNAPDAPKVEFIKNGDKIQRIIVSFGSQKVEIECQY